MDYYVRSKMPILYKLIYGLDVILLQNLNMIIWTLTNHTKIHLEEGKNKKHQENIDKQK